MDKLAALRVSYQQEPAAKLLEQGEDVLAVF